jgi:hypothetical protein
MAKSTVSQSVTVPVLRNWLKQSKADRLLYDHLPLCVEAAPPEIIRAFRDLKREGIVAKFVTCEDGIVFLRSTQAQEVAQ